MNNFAVPEIAAFVKSQWIDDIAALMGRSAEIVYNDEINLFDLDLGLIRVELMDGSIVEFRSSCAIVSGEKRAIAVLTEHCGYHVFPIHEAKVYKDGVLIYGQVGNCYP